MKRRIISITMVLLCVLPIVLTSVSASTYIPVTYAGQVVDSITYNGIKVDAIYAPYKSIKNYGSNTTYCCAAFVKKFYSQVYGVSVSNLLKNGGGPIVSGGGHFYAVSSPQIGDIVHDTTENTHWAIVKQVNGNTITLIEQNSWWNSRTTANVGRTVTVGTKGIKFYRYSNSINDKEDGADSPTVQVRTTAADSITETSAILRGRVSVTGGKATECGMYVGTSKNDMKWLKSDKINTSGTTFYYSTSKYGMPLTPGTTYYYQAYAIVNGKTSWGNVASFTTLDHVKGQYLWPEDSHPHYQYYICANCGATFTDGSTTTMESCEICYPKQPEPDTPPDKPVTKPSEPCSHVKGKYLRPGDAHPHYLYYECANCGETFTDGSTTRVDSCEICNPSPVTQTYYVFVNVDTGYLAINSQPSSANQIGRMPSGARVTVYPDKSSGNWCWVEYGGVSGYAYSSYLTTTVPATQTGIVAGTSGQYLAINDKPAASPAHSTQIGRIPPGGTVTVYVGNNNGNWYWVEYGGVYGWAYGKYISLN